MSGSKINARKGTVIKLHRCKLKMNAIDKIVLLACNFKKSPLNSALSMISKQKHKRFDIEANYWNKSKTFQSVPKIFKIELERFGVF